jgi:ParB family transcriptional regulator, chromosome partitioning protein
MPEMKYIALEQLIEPPNPMRLAMDDEKMQELIDDIKEQGILQNLVVVLSGDGGSTVRPISGEKTAGITPDSAPIYEIVAGHRRYKAACAAGLKDAPCLIFTDKTLAKHAAMSAENTLREDVSPAEEAYWYAELIEKYDFTEDQLSKTVHKPLNYIYARLNLLKGNPAVLEAVKERQIVLSVAQQLNRVDNDQHCRYLTHLAVEGGATARMVMEWVTEYKKNGPSPVVDITAFKEAGKQGAAEHGPAKCFLCKSNSYPSNIVWVPIHDFERDQILRQIESLGTVPVSDEETPR